jgi:hypothetical protein
MSYSYNVIDSKEIHLNTEATKVSSPKHTDQTSNTAEWLQLLDPVVLEQINDPNLVNM